MGGTKRRHNDGDVVANETKVGEDSRSKVWDSRIESLKQEAKRIAAGGHPELKMKCAVFEKVKQMRLDAAKTHRELQMKNIGSLCNHEIHQAESLFSAAKRELQAKLVEEVNEQLRKLQDSKDKDIGPPTDSNTRVTTRKLRSKVSKGDSDEKPSSTKEGGSTSRSSTRKPRDTWLTNYNNGNMTLTHQTLTDTEIKRDINKMEREWRHQVKALDAIGRNAQLDVRVERGKLKLPSGLSLEKEDDVVVTSLTTNENFFGSIVDIGPSELRLLLTDGSESRVYIQHLRSGRCVINLDENSEPQP